MTPRVSGSFLQITKPFHGLPVPPQGGSWAGTGLDLRAKSCEHPERLEGCPGNTQSASLSHWEVEQGTTLSPQNPRVLETPALFSAQLLPDTQGSMDIYDRTEEDEDEDIASYTSHLGAFRFAPQTEQAHSKQGASVRKGVRGSESISLLRDCHSDPREWSSVLLLPWSATAADHIYDSELQETNTRSAPLGVGNIFQLTHAAFFLHFY